jgi:hypothetical protein
MNDVPTVIPKFSENMHSLPKWIALHIYAYMYNEAVEVGFVTTCRCMVATFCCNNF